MRPRILTSDLAARKEGDLAQGATNAASNIEDLIVLVQLQLQCQVVLVALERLLVRLVLPPMREVKGGAPACTRSQAFGSVQEGDRWLAVIRWHHT